MTNHKCQCERTCTLKTGSISTDVCELRHRNGLRVNAKLTLAYQLSNFGNHWDWKLTITSLLVKDLKLRPSLALGTCHFWQGIWLQWLACDFQKRQHCPTSGINTRAQRMCLPHSTEKFRFRKTKLDVRTHVAVLELWPRPLNTLDTLETQMVK